MITIEFIVSLVVATGTTGIAAGIINAMLGKWLGLTPYQILLLASGGTVVFASLAFIIQLMLLLMRIS